MEILLFKIGFTSLIEEFEHEKNITADNSKKIAQLEKNFELLIKFMEMTKNRLSEESDTLKRSTDMDYGIYNTSKIKEELSQILKNYKEEINKTQSSEIERLKKEIASLKRDLRAVVSGKNITYESKTVQEEKSASNSFRVVIDEVSLKNRPHAGSKTIRVLKRDEIVQFLGCDRHGWCEVVKNGGYAPRHLFLPAD